MKAKSNFLLLSLLVLVVDQWSKWQVERHLPNRGPLEVIPGFLNLIHVENSGVAFGMFAANGNRFGTLALTLLGLAALTLVAIYFWKTPSDQKLLLTSLALILGGAVGNLVDRVAAGAVTDFIDAYVGTYHWHTFNVADSAITVGIVLMALDIFVARDGDTEAHTGLRAGIVVTGAGGSEVESERIELQAQSDAEGERLDRYLARTLDVPRNQIRKWIDEDRVLVDDRTVRPSHKLVPGCRIVCHRPVRSQPDSMRPESGEIEVLHEDDHLVVIDKPAGLTVHPGAGQTGGTLANRLLYRYPEIAVVGGPGRPGIVHRLDKDTTGVLTIARTERAYRELSRAFAEREVDKTYVAIVYGDPDPPEGRIDLPIGRHPHRRVEMAVRRGGRPARTGFRRLATGAGISVVELDLETGRTHQIRVHLKALGHPLVGDPVYGEARWKGLPRTAQPHLRSFARPALHAWRIELRHPVGGDRIRVEAPVPEDLQHLWKTVTGTVFPA